MRSLFVTAAVLAALGCGRRGGPFAQPLVTLGPEPTDYGAVYANVTTSRLILVRHDRAPAIAPLAPLARDLAPLPSRRAVAVLGGEARSPAVEIVPLDRLAQGDLASGDIARVPLTGPFDGLWVDEADRYAVATYAAAGAGVGRVARNLNEVAVIDFDVPAASRMLLETESLAPREIVFARRTAFDADPQKHLAAVLLDRGVALLDLARPEQRPLRVTIRPRGSTDDTTVRQAVFSRDASFLFVRAQGSPDVIAIEVGRNAAGDLTASLNFVAGGQGLVDLAVPDRPELAEMVFALFSQSRELWLLHARGLEDRAKRLALPDALTRLDRVSAARVMATAPGASRAVVVWDPLADRSAVAQFDLAFRESFVAVDRAAFAHSPARGPASLSVLSVTEQGTTSLRARIHPIALAAPLAAGYCDPVAGRLLFAAANSLVTLDLASLALAEVALDGPSERVAAMPGLGLAAAIHKSPLGDATLVPSDGFDRASAVRVRDFLLAGELDATE